MKNKERNFFSYSSLEMHFEKRKFFFNIKNFKIYFKEKKKKTEANNYYSQLLIFILFNDMS